MPNRRPNPRPPSSRHPVTPRAAPVPPAYHSFLELEVLEGLKPFVYHELSGLFHDRIEELPGEDEPDVIRLRIPGDPRDLRAMLTLRMATAIYLGRTLAIEAPRALLIADKFALFKQPIDQVRRLHSAEAFRTFTISAAGRDSATLVAVRDRVAAETGLIYSPDEADLVIRIRPSPIRSGWDVLIRMSPRPLVTRAWRVYNMLGALNASVAAAMIDLTYPRASDRYFNAMCGSGTLLIERLLHYPARQAIGCDWDNAALAGAALNLKAAGLDGRAELMKLDVTALPFPAASFDVICTDLPWGQLVGSHAQNVVLYPKVLRELARVAAPGARFVALTHEISLMEDLIEEDPDWVVRDIIRVAQGGLHPRLFVLQRRTIR